MDRSLVTRLVGVIDLLDGNAVHAIAGRRQHYRPVPFCTGSASGLADHYRALGLTRLYVADLDAIGGSSVQWSNLVGLLQSGFDRVLIDIGWNGLASSSDRMRVAELAERFPSSRWIVATESCHSLEAFAALGKTVSPQQVFLGLDFRAGEFVGDGGSMQQWLAAARRCQAGGVVVLDVAAVGIAGGPMTLEICRNVAELAPELEMYSGGGVRDSRDVEKWLACGCRGVLAATALYPGGTLSEFAGTERDSGFDFPLESFD